MTTALHQPEVGRAPVQDLPALAPLPPNPRLPRIEVQAAFAARCAVAVLDRDGKPGWNGFIAESGLDEQSVDAVNPRLAHFGTTRPQSMAETGVACSQDEAAGWALKARAATPVQARGASTVTGRPGSAA